jgi:hypothetical protein
MELLRDPLWQFVGALLTLVTIFVAIYLFIKDRTKKSIIYQVKLFLPVLSIDEKEKGDFHVLFKDQEIHDLFLISICVVNSGNMPITTQDYEKPVTFIFGETSRVYSAEVISTQPKDLIVELSIKDNSVTLAPLLLNSGDMIEIKSLVTSPDMDKFKSEGRVIGVKEIVEKRINTNRSMGWAVIGIMIMGLSLIGMLITRPIFDLRNLQPLAPFWILAFIGGVIAISGITRAIYLRGLDKYLTMLGIYVKSVFRNS